MKLTWLGHAGFKIETENKIIYIDPYLPVNGKADIILITQSQYDHFVKKNIEKLSIDNTKIIGPKKVISEIDGITVNGGDNIIIEGIPIEITKAYNVKRENHQKEERVGYIINLEGKRLYHTGDTDLIPEMNFYESNIVLIPVGGTYTMNDEEAAHTIKVLAPKIAIPMHYGEIAGSEENARHFKEITEKETEVEVKILEKGKNIEI